MPDGERAGQIHQRPAECERVPAVPGAARAAPQRREQAQQDRLGGRHGDLNGDEVDLLVIGVPGEQQERQR